MSETLTTCPFCGERVDPNQAGVVYGVPRVNVPAFDRQSDSIDGDGRFFHPGCPLSAVGYVAVPLPGADLTTP